MRHLRISAVLAVVATFVLAGILTFADADQAHAQTMCPDGTYVGGDRCNMAPDGSYVGGDGVTMAPDGSYVGTYRQRNRDGGNRSDDWWDRY